MADLTPEQLEAALSKQAETLARIINEKKGGTGGGVPEFQNVGTGAKDVARSLKNARDALDNYGLRSKEYSKTQQMGNFAANLFGKSTEQAARAAQRLDGALYEQQRALEALMASGKKADDVEVKRLKNNIEGLQRTKNFHGALEQGAGAVKGALGVWAGSLVKLQQVQVNYIIGVSQAAAQGADGFVLAGKAMEATAERANAVAHMYADMQVTAGNALSNMGGKAAPLAGAALTFLGNTAKQTADMTLQLEKNRISIMVAEGSKLIKTYQTMTSSGIIFGNGMQGMIDATSGTKLRLEEMAAVVKDNRETFANLGIGMSQATSYIGKISKILASTTGRFAYADRQMLALGLSYQEQAALAAENAAQLATSKGPAAESKVAQATIEMAKNMALVAEVTGEDAKTRKKAAQEEMANAAFQAKLAEIREKDPAKAKAIEDSVNAMDKRSAKIAADMFVNNGRATLQSNAVAMTLNSGQRKQMQAWYKSVEDGTASSKKSLELEKQYSKEKREGAIAQRSVNQAAYLGLGGSTVKDQADYAKDVLETTRKSQSTPTVATAEANVNKLIEGAKTGKGDKTTQNLIMAQELGALAAKKLQAKVIGMLDRLAADMQRASDDAVAALDAVAPPVNKLANIVEKLLPALLALTVLSPLLSGAAKVFKSFKGIPEGAPGNMANKGPARYAKGTIVDGKNVGGQFMPKAAVAAKEAEIVAKEASLLGKGFSAIGKKLPYIGTAIATLLAGYEIYNTEQELAAGKISKNEARKEEAGIVGQAAGGIGGMIAGGAVGAEIGLAIGAALAPFTAGVSLAIGPALGALVGGVVGAFSGGAIGKAIGEKSAEILNWSSIVIGDLVEAGEAVWGQFKEGAAKLWTNVKSQWTEATTAAYGWMKSTFPGLTSWIESAAGKAAKFAEDSWNSAKKGYDSLSKSVTDMLSSMGDAASKWWGDKAQKIKDFVPEWMGGSDKNSVTSGNKNWLTGKERGAERQAEINKNKTPAAAPLRDPKEFNDSDRSNVGSWVQAVIKDPKRLAEVPEVYKSEVARLTKGKIPANAIPSASDVKTAVTNTASKLLPESTIPQQKALSAAEKAAAMETVAANTKYANDLLTAMQKTMHADNRAMVNLLNELVGHGADTASSSRKTAQRVQ